MPDVRAVVDCGSNSTRLWLDDGSDEVVRLEQVTRLGQGVDRSGRLHPDAMDRTFAVVDDYVARWRASGVTDDQVVVIATSAVRDADNGDRFVERMVDVAGVPPRILTGEQEARASFLGATSHRSPIPTLVVDIGGGSTELVVGTAGTTEDLAAVSLQLGTVRLTERCLHDDPPTREQLDRARQVATRLVTGGLADVGVAGGAGLQVVAVAGTATTLAGLDAGDDAVATIDDHVLSADRLAALADDLATRSAAQRLELGPLDTGRADVIAAGALVLDVIVRQIGANGVTVSITDVMDGIALGAA